MVVCTCHVYFNYASPTNLYAKMIDSFELSKALANKHAECFSLKWISDIVELE